jgi:hypothetical protein
MGKAAGWRAASGWSRGIDRLGFPLPGNSFYTILNWDHRLNKKKYGNFFAKMHSTNLQQLFLVGDWDRAP